MQIKIYNLQIIIIILIIIIPELVRVTLPESSERLEAWNRIYISYLLLIERHFAKNVRVASARKLIIKPFTKPAERLDGCN